MLSSTESSRTFRFCTVNRKRSSIPYSTDFEKIASQKERWRTFSSRYLRCFFGGIAASLLRRAHIFQHLEI